ncbi:hypothetical protein [Carnimonas nigrificans]|uniref:hypothetical protein n=1 Tax=Carnimonas nigrificans TaxID=64323 RepID=UPI00046FAE93|nr:hypothetical protein [Carnimonas nigrificans]
MPTSRILSLSDGARPTEALYFDHTIPWLEREGIQCERIDAFARSPLFTSKWRSSRWQGAHILITRSLPLVWLRWLQRHRSRLGRIFYLVDDDFAAAAADPALPAKYRKRMTKLAHRIQPGILELADEVVVACHHLQQQLGRRHRKVSLLTPSLIPPLPTLEHQSHHQVEIGFHGTRAHLPDLQAVTPALVDIVKSRSDITLELMLGDYTPPALQALEAVNTPAPLPWQAFLEYQRQHRLQIGIAPLWPTDFNAGKSWIKFLDIAVMGGVGIYSKRAPYTEVVEDGVDGLLVEDTPGAWYEALHSLASSPQTRLKMAQAAARKALTVGDPQIARQFWLERLW